MRKDTLSRKIIYSAVVVCFMSVSNLASGQKLDKLTVENIMRDPMWIGSSPSSPYWSIDGKRLFFRWNPEKRLSDSIYYITKDSLQPKKASYQLRQATLSASAVAYNNARTAYTYAKNDDIFLVDVKTGNERRITKTAEVESNPGFVESDTKIVFSRNQNLYTWDISSGLITQLTNFQRGSAPPKDDRSLNAHETWLKNDQLRNMEVLRTRKEKRDSAEAAAKTLPKEKPLRAIYSDDKTFNGINVSPTGRFISYRLSKAAANAKTTIVPNYVTESGFTTDIPTRTKVGAPTGTSEFYIFDAVKDTVYLIKPDQLPGITDLPDYARDTKTSDTSKRRPALRAVTFYGPYWNERGSRGVVEARSADNKDRWLLLLDTATAKLRLLDRQRDEAWIGGPGTSPFGGADNRWINDSIYWFQSEATGYSHLYTINVNTGLKKQLTSGKFEVQQADLSIDKKTFFIVTNEVHPGEQHFYRMPVNGGKPERVTTMTGANQVTLSPDEKQLAILYSYSTKPWELFIQENKPGATARQVTFDAQSEEFKSYPWKDPEVVTFTASDGAQVYARLYKPATPHPTKPAVVFVHGAGYLQNAHKWWSTYFREYMFHNLLVDQGYTVLDIDYRGSAGYGRDWRTGIYRFMGGKNLSDHIDGAKFLTEKHGVDPKRIGIYGGSYGGFITLMAMFTQPDVFAAGAALRSVTDWAHYNHGYTSNILNEPFADTLAYKKSSPIYYAEGLKGALLMAHGMVDVNVHFQDIVRLTQRLIELKKENWELAVYPMEDHGFVEPTSWMDEYKRILKLMDTNLKK
jgi:dipeptidyl aminopeptidase/acylaminoacyl peptidase